MLVICLLTESSYDKVWRYDGFVTSKVSADTGWGVSCSIDLPAGAFICCYIGKIITDE
jgi:hypothetical protein